MHLIYLIHEFKILNLITEINELFHDIQIYWDAPVYSCGHKFTHTLQNVNNNVKFNKTRGIIFVRVCVLPWISYK